MVTVIRPSLPREVRKGNDTTSRACSLHVALREPPYGGVFAEVRATMLGRADRARPHDAPAIDYPLIFFPAGVWGDGRSGRWRLDLLSAAPIGPIW